MNNKYMFPTWFYILSCIESNEVKMLNNKFDDETNIRFIYHKTNLNYNNILINIKFLIDNGFIITKKKGRNCFIYLTFKGRDTVKAINKILEVTKNVKKQRNINIVCDIKKSTGK